MYGGGRNIGRRRRTYSLLSMRYSQVPERFDRRHKNCLQKIMTRAHNPTHGYKPGNACGEVTLCIK